MSSKEIQRIVCPKCGAEHDFEVWSRINTELDPSLKMRVKTGELFRTVCPSCGQPIDVVYPCLYHDMGEKFMIYYAPGKEAMEKATAALEEGKDDIRARRGFEPEKEGYRNRVVGSLYDLQEKIALFEAGLDDRIVEICKVIVGSELQESRPDAVFDDLLYYRGQDGDDRLALMKDGNSFASIAIPREVYDEVGTAYKALIDNYGDETVIDMDWVMKSVIKANV